MFLHNRPRATALLAIALGTALDLPANSAQLTVTPLSMKRYA